MLHISTDYVFDGKTASPYIEQDAPTPISSYGHSKKRGEDFVLEADGKNLVVRVSWVFGPDRPSFIDAIISRALKEECVEAVCDKFSSPAYTLDLAELLRPLLALPSLGGIFHLCNTGEASWQEYGQFGIDCARRAGLPVIAKSVGALEMSGMKSFVAQRPPYSVMSTKKYADFIGKTPRHWHDALEDYVRHHLAPRFPKPP